MSESNLKVVVYTSQATDKVTDEFLEALHLNCIKSNVLADVTGVLMYNDGMFFQYIEGKEETITKLLAKIRSDPRHNDFNLLLETKVAEREFPNWGMALFKPRRSELLNLINSDWWDGYGGALNLEDNAASGLVLMKAMCDAQLIRSANR